MGYELYFINETKKQIVGSKRLYANFEDREQLLAYLSMCKGDTIRIVGEEDGLIEREVFAEPKEYRVINLYEYRIDHHRENDAEITRLQKAVEGL